MRNDFYQGMFEDRYLAHTDLGAGGRRFHKYLYREWRNGKWRYYYGKLNRGVTTAREELDALLEKRRKANYHDAKVRRLGKIALGATKWVTKHTVGANKKG